MTQLTLKSWFRVISGVLAILIVSVSVLDCVPLLLLLFEIYTLKRRSAVVDNYFFYPIRDVYIAPVYAKTH